MQSPQQLTFLKSRLVLPVTTYSKSTTRHITIVNNGLPTSQSGNYNLLKKYKYKINNTLGKKTLLMTCQHTTYFPSL